MPGGSRRWRVIAAIAAALALPAATAIAAAAENSAPATPAIVVNSVPPRSDCIPGPTPQTGAVTVHTNLPANVTLTGATIGQMYVLGAYPPGSPIPMIKSLTPDTDPFTADLELTPAIPGGGVFTPYGGRMGWALYVNGDINRSVASTNTTVPACPGFAWPTARCPSAGGDWYVVHPGNERKFSVQIDYGGAGGTYPLLKTGGSGGGPDAKYGEMLIHGYDAVLMKDEFNYSRILVRNECPAPEPIATATATATETATASPEPTPSLSATPAATATPVAIVTPAAKLLASSAVVSKNGTLVIKLHCASAQCTTKVTISYKATVRGKTKRVVVATKRVVLKKGPATTRIRLSKGTLRKLKQAKVTKLQIALD
jgi:hypothetical protein